MTNDELRPESPASETTPEPLFDSVAETSDSGAPPAKPVRRRRTITAGTDAASAQANPDKPKTTRRNKNAENNPTEHNPTEHNPNAEVQHTPQHQQTPQTTQEASPPPRRRSKTKTDDSAIANSTPAPTPETPNVPPTEQTNTGAKRTRQPRKTTQETTPTETLTHNTTPPEASDTAEISTTPATAEPATKAPRTRSRRAVPETPPTLQETANNQEAIQPAPLAPNEDAEPDEAPQDNPSPQSRNRRNRNRRRERIPVAELNPAPEAPPTPEPTSAPETTETAEEGAARRSRRNRRGGRGRRNREGEPLPTEAKLETIEARTETILTPTETPIEPLAPMQEEEPAIDKTYGAHLLFRNGIPEIRINNNTYPPVLFFGNVSEADTRDRVLSEVRKAAKAGVHLHSTLIELPCPLEETSAALDEFDNRIRAVLDADPNGFVMPRLAFITARGWKREYPHEMANYNGEITQEPSLTSERFWQEAERSLVTLIEHIQQQSWGTRLFGYHLERAEWFHPIDQGFDRSTANRDAFRDWLRDKYRNNIVSLRAAWHDGSVQFHTADIPQLPEKPNQQRAFFETRRERPIIDFQEFLSDSVATRLAKLAKVVKKASNYEALVSVCYGYTLEFGHGYSGHLALQTLLQSPHIDLVCGPPSYRDRKLGDCASLPAPLQSFPLHGKLWLSEDDTKTYLAPVAQDPEDFNPRFTDKYATEQAHLRAMGKALTSQTALGWMDLWGEGWLDDDVIWERLGAFSETYSKSLQHQAGTTHPEVVVLIDERSLLHLQRGEEFFRKITNGLRDALQRSGADYGLYLQSDVLHPNFPANAKLYLFLTPYRLPLEQRAAISEKLQNGGKTLCWLYAPNSCEERPSVGGSMEETARGVVGMILRQQEWNSEVGSRVLMPHHPITERLSGREFGTRERLNPSFYVEDPDVTALAEYQGSGLTSLAVRDFGKWKSVFVGEPTLSLDLVRGICRYAGVHLWAAQGEDVLQVGGNWLAVHASGREGQRSWRFPTPTALYDYTDRRLISEEIREHRYFMKAGQTRLFYFGSRAQLEAMGFLNAPPPKEKVRPLPEVDLLRERPTTPPTPVVVPEPLPEPIAETPKETPPIPAPAIEHTPDIQSDIDTLRAILSMDTQEMEIEEPSTEATTLASNRRPLPRPLGGAPADVEELFSFQRKRRRRGGRGRGSRPGEGGDNEGDDAED